MHHSRKSVIPNSAKMQHSTNLVKPNSSKMKHTTNLVILKSEKTLHTNNLVKLKSAKTHHTTNLVKLKSAKTHHTTNLVKPKSAKTHHTTNLDILKSAKLPNRTILKLLFVISLSTFVDICSGQHRSQMVSSSRCEPISIGLCKDLPYNFTQMPNVFNHRSQKDAELEINSFKALVEVGCSIDTRFFLCSMYTPICIPTYPESIPVCRSVCERVKQSCFPLMQPYGFQWPDKMECSNFPERKPGGSIPMCMDPEDERRKQSQRAPPETPLVINAGGGGDSNGFTLPPEFINNHHLFKDKFNSLAGKNAADENNNQCNENCKTCGSNWNQVVNSLVRLNPGDRQYNRTSNYGGIPNCANSCYDPHLNDADFRVIETWMKTCTGVCFVFSLVTIFTFCINLERFKYPERAVMYISLCYLMIAIGFIIRFICGHDLSCEPQHISSSSASASGGLGYTSYQRLDRNQLISKYNFKIDSTTSSDSSSYACIAVFIFMYTFGMASVIWWVILNVTWFLLSGLRWAPEAVSRYSHWFHITAWFIPILKTIIILGIGAIDGDPVSGICYVGAQNQWYLLIFVIVPMALYLAVGFIFLLSGVYLICRSDLKSRYPADQVSKLYKLVLKIILFSVMYIILIVLYLACNIYEVLSASSWQEAIVCQECLSESNKQRPILDVFILKYSLMTIIGAISVFWIVSEKTLFSWKLCFLTTCNCGCAPDFDKQQQQQQQQQLQQQQQFQHLQYQQQQQQQQHLKASHCGSSTLMTTTTTTKNPIAQSQAHSTTTVNVNHYRNNSTPLSHV